ncbi:uncharacterized protein L203_105221 [Cryptococcus depauperatus CBS 7841]|uniref:Uncharacterized protein n=1 Tax=Cryptococcus depauperatus CBS 7841 TaxID=1295531 RepID=A0AAJ8JWU9_9TREE
MDDTYAPGAYFSSTGADPSQNTFAGPSSLSQGGTTPQTTCNAYSGGSTVQGSLPPWQVDHNKNTDQYLKDNGIDKEELNGNENELFIALYTYPRHRTKDQKKLVSGLQAGVRKRRGREREIAGIFRQFREASRSQDETTQEATAREGTDRGLPCNPRARPCVVWSGWLGSTRMCYWIRQ